VAKKIKDDPYVWLDAFAVQERAKIDQGPVVLELPVPK
jgi:hypothetical protein